MEDLARQKILVLGLGVSGRSAASFCAARGAEVVGADEVRLALFPRFTSRSGRIIDVTELRTDVVVPHGQTMVVGGLEESQDSLAYALFSLGGRRGDRRTLLLVTPYIEAARPGRHE